MKMILKGALLATLALSPLTAFAQSQQGAQGGAASGAVGGAVVGAVVGGPIGAVIGGAVGATTGAAVGGIAADDRVYIQRYVYERQVAPVTVQERVVVGEPLPRAVTTYTFEGNPRLAGYRYAYVNNQYILVSSDGRVMGSIER
ncbi:MAG: DUF1236 domain-containing protein [Pseudolabrys sp.]|nr:DUF1236 domain-containing protein [Pseudolabrys sp.]MBV9955440.1 DUF1236 domain-containing protein [Pseudolabrys sp.]